MNWNKGRCWWRWERSGTGDLRRFRWLVLRVHPRRNRRIAIQWRRWRHGQRGQRESRLVLNVQKEMIRWFDCREDRFDFFVFGLIRFIAVYHTSKEQLHVSDRFFSRRQTCWCSLMNCSWFVHCYSRETKAPFSTRSADMARTSRLDVDVRERHVSRTVAKIVERIQLHWLEYARRLLHLEYLELAVAVAELVVMKWTWGSLRLFDVHHWYENSRPWSMRTVYDRVLPNKESVSVQLERMSYCFGKVKEVAMIGRSRFHPWRLDSFVSIDGIWCCDEACDRQLLRQVEWMSWMKRMSLAMMDEINDLDWHVSFD